MAPPTLAGARKAREIKTVPVARDDARRDAAEARVQGLCGLFRIGGAPRQPG
jgi:hypothetical protein